MSKSKKKKVKVSEKPKGIKEARNTENPESYYDKTPKWVFKDMDVDHEKWSLQKQQHLSLYYRKDERLRRNDLGRNHEGNRRKKNRE